MISRGRLFFLSFTFRSCPPGAVGVQFRQINRPLLGVEPIKGLSVSVRSLRRRLDLQPLIDHAYETFTGFFIGSVCGIGIGFLLGRKEVLADILDPYVVAFNGIPRIALAPLFIIWFGIGPTAKVILVVSVVFF